MEFLFVKVVPKYFNLRARHALVTGNHYMEMHCVATLNTILSLFQSPFFLYICFPKMRPAALWHINYV